MCEICDDDVICGQCGKPGRMQVDPFMEEIHGDSTEVALCNDCAAANADDI